MLSYFNFSRNLSLILAEWDYVHLSFKHCRTRGLIRCVGFKERASSRVDAVDTRFTRSPSKHMGLIQSYKGRDVTRGNASRSSDRDPTEEI